MLAKLLNIGRDRRVRDFENFRDATIIHLDLKYVGVWVALRKFENVLEIRAAPRVDRLRVVAHHHHVSVIQREQINEVSLDLVRVLIFIDKDELKLPPIKCGDAFVLL